MKKKIILTAFFFTCGIVNSFCDENPLIFLDFGKVLEIDSLKSVLQEKGYSFFEEKPSIYGSNIYGGYKVKCYGNGASDQFKLSISYTPNTRKIYSFEISREIPSKRFRLEALNFYKVIEKEYGVPFSGALLNGDYFRADTDDEHKEQINANEIKIDSAYLISCIESKQPVEYYWKVNDARISFSVHQLSNYDPHITCEIYYGRIADLNIKEINLIKDDLEHKETIRTLKTITIGTLVAILFTFLICFYIRTSIKHKKEQKEKELVRQQIREIKQKEIDIKHEEYKKQLIDKYGPITRIISNNLYNDDFIMNYDEIFVFEKPKKIIFGKKECDFADILSCSMYDENHKDIPPTQVTRTNTGSMLGRAAVGGLTLGVAGAVVGAMTAKTESTSNEDTSYISSYVVKIGIKSIEKPTMILKYGSDKAKAEEVYALVQAIIAMK